MTGAGVIITKLTRHDDGPRPWYSANASVNGSTRTFDNRAGSWLTRRRPRADDWPAGAEAREARPAIAKALQAKLPRDERSRR